VKTYERLIYFDPTRSDYVLPFNIHKSPFHPYIVAQQVVEAFRRTGPQALEEAPRFSNIARAALLVLIETGQTLVEMTTARIPSYQVTSEQVDTVQATLARTHGEPWSSSSQARAPATPTVSLVDWEPVR